MARSKNQSARRLELLDAAEQALVERGRGDLRVKDIADVVGLTPTAVAYYYPDLEELVVQVYRRVTERYATNRARVVAGLSEPRKQLAAMIELGVPSGPDDRDGLLTYQLAGEPRAATRYADLSGSLFTTEVMLYSAIIGSGADAGVMSPVLEGAVVARALVALEDSYGLRIVVDDSGISHDEAVAEIRAVAETLVEASLPPAGPAT
ncbi:MAG: TetR/AcrR family transcriptional regulator [Nocardioidaceae bacterium]